VRRLLLCGFTIIAISAQQSLPPPPAPAISSQTQQNNAGAKQTKAASDNHSADLLVTAIDKLTTEIAGRNQQNPHTKSGNPSTLDCIKVTDWLIALATLFLAAVAIFQYCSMQRQANYMRRGLALTKRAARAATASAIRTCPAGQRHCRPGVASPLGIFDGRERSPAPWTAELLRVARTTWPFSYQHHRVFKPVPILASRRPREGAETTTSTPARCFCPKTLEVR
jgi:hypothetical protein